MEAERGEEMRQEIRVGRQMCFGWTTNIKMRYSGEFEPQTDKNAGRETVP